jgi:hypothetical protein
VHDQLAHVSRQHSVMLKWVRREIGRGNTLLRIFDQRLSTQADGLEKMMAFCSKSSAIGARRSNATLKIVASGTADERLPAALQEHDQIAAPRASFALDEEERWAE